MEWVVSPNSFMGHFASKVLAVFGKSYSGKKYEPQFEGDFPLGGLSYYRYRKAIPTVQHQFPTIKLAAIEYSNTYKPAVFSWSDGGGSYTRIVGLGISLAPCKSIAKNMQRPDFRSAFINGMMRHEVTCGKHRYCGKKPLVCTLGCRYGAKLNR